MFAVLALGSPSRQSACVNEFQCTHLHHAFVVVDDLDAARTFYRDVLHLKEVPRPASFDFPGFWMQVGNEQVHVATSDQPDTRRSHFALEVTDYEAAIAHLEAHGVKVRLSAARPDAGPQASFRDPAGNQLEIRPAPAG